MFRIATNFKSLRLPALTLVKRFAHETPDYKRIPFPPYEGHDLRNAIVGAFVLAFGSYAVMNMEDDFDFEDQDLLAAILAARTNGPQATQEEAIRDVLEDQKNKRVNKRKEKEVQSITSKSSDEKEK
jgi:hypothetical protein